MHLPARDNLFRGNHLTSLSSIDLSLDFNKQSHGGEKIQFTKLGNSKILVVKKKLGGILSTNTTPGQTAAGGNSQNASAGSQSNYQSHSLQRTQLDEYSNSLFDGQYGGDKTGAKVQNSRSFTPNRPQTAAVKGSSSENETSSNMRINSKLIQHQMININNLAASDKPYQKPAQNKSHLSKHVGFNLQTDKLIADSKGQATSEASSAERAEENRQLNSKRQFQIKKGGRSNAKSKGLKSPADFTQSAKSVTTMFSVHSGNSNNSEPLQSNGNSIENSPDYKAKFNLKKKYKGVLKVKKRIRPSSSISHIKSQGSLNDQSKKFNLSATSFNKFPKAQKPDKETNDRKDVSVEILQKNMIPMKKISLKKTTIQSHSITGLPKPPLHKKNLFDEHSQSMGNCGSSAAEALLKIADESIAALDHDLKESKLKSKTTLHSLVSSCANSVEKKPRQVTLKPKEKIQANFNLSFNNSFNTSYNNQNQNQPQQLLAFSSSANKLEKQPVQGPGQEQPAYQGFFTPDAIYLEKHLTKNLQDAKENEGKKMQAFNQTFSEIIKCDKNFGSLLLKIKKAYDDYIKKSTISQLNSPEAGPSYEELLSKVRTQDSYIISAKQIQDDLNNSVQRLKEQLDEKQKSIEILQQDNESLQAMAGKNESFKISQNHKINRSASLGETMKSLQLSNSSNRTNSVKGSCKQGGQKLSRGQLIKDLNMLVQQNMQFNQECQLMQNEVTYFKLREKKIMYLVTILQNKGYPVNQVFDSEVKNIPTMRFQEFLDNNPDIEDPDDDVKNLFSFRSEDSYERLQTGPLLVGLRPDFVPILNLNTLPVYESSSDEEEPNNFEKHPQKQLDSNPVYYQESLKYIENYYNKYAGDKPKGCTQSVDYNTSVHQISYQDTLSRDEDGDDGIQEEFQYA